MDKTERKAIKYAFWLTTFTELAKLGVAELKAYLDKRKADELAKKEKDEQASVECNQA